MSASPVVNGRSSPAQEERSALEDPRPILLPSTEGKNIPTKPVLKIFKRDATLARNMGLAVATAFVLAFASFGGVDFLRALQGWLAEQLGEPVVLSHGKFGAVDPGSEDG